MNLKIWLLLIPLAVALPLTAHAGVDFAMRGHTAPKIMELEAWITNFNNELDLNYDTDYILHNAIHVEHLLNKDGELAAEILAAVAHLFGQFFEYVREEDFHAAKAQLREIEKALDKFKQIGAAFYVGVERVE